jgi:anti-sigma factor RsiW
MSHPQWTEKLDIYLDDELPTADAAGLDRHLRECAECTAELARRVQMKNALRSAGTRYAPDPALRERMRKSIAKSAPAPRLWRWWPAVAAAIALLLVLGGAAIIQQNSRRVRNNQIVGELADLHVATLASGTPVDVVSTDKHTVKPWFAGRIPFTFNLPELQGTEFELVGGRVSYLEQSPGAELIFRVRKHQISVFIFQDRAVPLDMVGGAHDARSFNMETWRANGLRYFVIGDAGAGDIKALSELMKKAL